MKQKIYILGLVTALIVFSGTIFKISHFPGANILLTLGLATMVLLFLPMALRNHYISGENRQNLSLYIVTWVTCLVIFTAMLFKLMLWPYAGLLLTIALPFPYIVFLPVFIYSTSKDRNFNIYNTVFVLLLVALNSVFSGLLALNVTKKSMDDSMNLSRDFNRLEQVLIQANELTKQTSVNILIDDVLNIVADYQDVILKNENLTRVNWINEPGNLIRPDFRGIAAISLLNSGESTYGSRLANGLKNLIKEMQKTPGYEDLAKSAPAIFDFVEPVDKDSDWAKRFFNDRNLAWVLIYLDGLRYNLLSIKASAGMMP